MYCGACGRGNSDESNFCSGCGKPLKLAAAASQQNGRYGVILQSVPHDASEKRRAIEQIIRTLMVSEPEAAAKVEHCPCVIASVESKAEAERLRQALKPLEITIFSPTEKEELPTMTGLVKCRSCDREIPRTAGNCPHCGEMLIKCPRCGGMNIGCGQRGFGLGRALATGVVLGPAVGLLAGMAGRGLVELRCQQCGAIWMPNGR